MRNKKTDLQLEKNKIRQEILKKRNNLSTEEVEKKKWFNYLKFGKIYKKWWKNNDFYGHEKWSENHKIDGILS